MKCFMQSFCDLNPQIHEPLIVFKDKKSCNLYNQMHHNGKIFTYIECYELSIGHLMFGNYMLVVILQILCIRARE
jgi:hypothetical protein